METGGVAFRPPKSIFMMLMVRTCLFSDYRRSLPYDGTVQKTVLSVWSVESCNLVSRSAEVCLLGARTHTKSAIMFLKSASCIARTGAALASVASCGAFPLRYVGPCQDAAAGGAGFALEFPTRAQWSLARSVSCDGAPRCCDPFEWRGLMQLRFHCRRCRRVTARVCVSARASGHIPEGELATWPSPRLHSRVRGRTVSCVCAICVLDICHDAEEARWQRLRGWRFLRERWVATPC